jgi:hypothetical protein
MRLQPQTRAMQFRRSRRRRRTRRGRPDHSPRRRRRSSSTRQRPNLSVHLRCASRPRSPRSRTSHRSRAIRSPRHPPPGVYWNSNLMLVADLQPVEVAQLRERAHGGLVSACAAGMLVDSISGQCAKACPDGSPRHNDVCAVSGQCPDGTVNLTGECLMAAPAHSSGADPTSHVRWSCGAGGCAYFVPQGFADCKASTCSVSCPAPDFRLATTQKGVVCVE